ncbi:BTB/POZ domain-containing protein [Ditylenchus destructor]|nr:BTB/POZ domain-containing protein [Ditylenchus destructor]
MSSSDSSSDCIPIAMKNRKNAASSSSSDSSDSDDKSDYRLVKDYSKYVIVAENEFKTPGDIGKSTEVAFHNALWKISDQPGRNSRVCCDYIFSTNTDFLAEILFVDGKDKTLKKRENFKVGTILPCLFHCSWVVIRILEERTLFEEKLAELWAPDVTFVVNGEKCEANRQYLANASPVFRKMLFGKFAEATQSEIVLEGIGSADVFKDFLLAISPLGVQNMMQKCEEHLKFCYEIPLADRIFLAAEYDLNDLKAHTAHVMTNDQWKKMWKEHKEKLLEPEFLYLFDIITDRLK